MTAKTLATSTPLPTPSNGRKRKSVRVSVDIIEETPNKRSHLLELPVSFILLVISSENILLFYFRMKMMSLKDPGGEVWLLWPVESMKLIILRKTSNHNWKCA